MGGHVVLDSPGQIDARELRGRERRREHRIPSNDPGSLQVLKPFSPEMHSIRIVEVSRGGLKLRVPNSLKPGTIVQIHSKTTIAIGEVRHCTAVDNEFYAGVKLAEVIER